MFAQVGAVGALVGFLAVVSNTTTETSTKIDYNSLDRLCPREVVYGQYEQPIKAQDI